MDCAQEILMKKQADYMWKIIRKNEVGLFNMIYFYFAFCLCEFLLEFLLLLLLLFVLFFLLFFFLFFWFFTLRNIYLNFSLMERLFQFIVMKNWKIIFSNYYFICKIYIRFSPFRKKDRLRSLNISKLINSKKCAYLNGGKLLFQNPLRELTCSRVSNTDEISTLPLLS